MPHLTPPSIDLVSVLRTVPAFGSPSSIDYNQNVRELLLDLSNLAGYVNDFLTPMLTSLSDDAANGLDGAKIYANPSSQNANFLDSSKQPLSIADVLVSLSNRVDAIKKVADNAAGLVQRLQSRLATNFEEDLRTSVQSLSDKLRNMQDSVASINLSVVGLAVTQAQSQIRIVPTGTISASSSTTISVELSSSFQDMNYVAFAALEQTNGNLEISNIVRISSSVVSVTIKNDGNTDTQCVINLLTRTV